MGILFGNGNIFWWVGSFSIEEEAGDWWRRFGDLDFGKGEKGGSGIVVLELGLLLAAFCHFKGKTEINKIIKIFITSIKGGF